MTSTKRRLIEALDKLEEFHRPNPDFPKCVICRKHFSGTPYGNNPAPIRVRGKCCDACNHNKVVPARSGSIRNPLGSWKLQYLKRKMETVIQHFPDNWREVVNEDAALYYTFEEFGKLAAKEGDVEALN
jgi:hypothetical protein